MPKQDGNTKIVESFMTSNKQMSLNNKNTYYNEYSDEVLIRYYQTLIAVRKGKSVRILEGINKYSASTNVLVKLIERIAEQKGCTVSYVKQFAKGSTVKGGGISETMGSFEQYKNKIYRELLSLGLDKEDAKSVTSFKLNQKYISDMYVGEKNYKSTAKNLYKQSSFQIGNKPKYGNGGGVAVSSESGLAFGTNAELLMNEQYLQYADGGNMSMGFNYSIGGL